MADETGQGVEIANALTGAARKTLALGAARKQYGDVFADPEVAKSAQEYGFNALNDPLKLAQSKASTDSMQATTAKTKQDTAFEASDHQRLMQYRALSALEGSVDPKTGSVDPDAFDAIIGPNAEALGLGDPQHAAALKAAMTAPGGAAHISTTRQALIGPTKVSGAPVVAQDAKGNSVLINRDQYGNTTQETLADGLTPVAQQRADTGQQNADTSLGRLDVSKLNAAERKAYDLIKGKIAQQNANTSARGEDLRANNSVFGQSGAEPAAPAGPAAGPGAANPQAPGGVTGAPGTVAPLFNSLPPKGRQAAIGQAQQIVNQKNNLTTVNALLDQVDKQITPWTAGAGSSLSVLPGGIQKDLKANLETLKAQGLTAWIQSMKNAQGQTGIGRVLQTEANAAMNLYGNMEQDQSAKQLAYHAALFRKAVNNLYATAHSGFKTMYGSDPEAVLSLGNDKEQAAPAAAAPAKAAGKLSDADLLKQYGVK